MYQLKENDGQLGRCGFNGMDKSCRASALRIITLIGQGTWITQDKKKKKTSKTAT